MPIFLCIRALNHRAALVFLTVLGMVAGPAHAGNIVDKQPKHVQEEWTSTPEVSLVPEASTPAIRPGLAGSFLSGRFARNNQDLKEAARYLNETLQHDPGNVPLQQEALRLNLLAGELVQATKLAHILAKTSPSDPLAASLIMLEQFEAGDTAAAKATMTQASGAGLFGLIRPVAIEWLSVAQGPKKSSVDMHAVVEKSGFFAPFIHYHVALMNDVIGSSAAKAAYAKANTDPGVTPYRVVEAIANFALRDGRREDAQAIYDAYAKANPQSSLIPETLTPGQVPAPLVADARQGLAELYFTTASILFGEDATQDTFLYLRVALALRPDLPPAQLMLANLYEQLGDYKQAIAVYESIAENTVFARRAQVRKALNYEALGQPEKAVALLDALAARYPNESTALITKGDMLREAKRFDQATEAYSLAIKRTEPLEADDWPLLYARGISYERAGDWEKAEADFTRALSLTPQQPDVLNYLAYSWLTMGKNMEKAREYLEAALEQRPDDPHIIDSTGWASFLVGDFKAAVQLFERAVELMPDDPTVNEHLGDAYWRVGRETEARFQWQRALQNKPEVEVGASLRDKLEKGLPPIAVREKPEVNASGIGKTTVQ